MAEPGGGAPIGLLWIAGGGASALLLLVAVRRRPRVATAALGVLGISLLGSGSPTSPSFSWVHGDHLGTPLAMTDTQATPVAAKVVWRATYEPFGLATVDADPDGDGVQVANDFRFPGQVFDAESGLHYNYFRDYDPSLGRYVSADPTGTRGGINPYAYTGGSPILRADSRGLAEDCHAPERCPKREPKAQPSWREQTGPTQTIFECFFHHCKNCYRENVPTNSAQCCYDRSGDLAEGDGDPHNPFFLPQEHIEDVGRLYDEKYGKTIGTMMRRIGKWLNGQ